MADDIENQPAPTAPMAQASQSIPFSVASIEPSAAPATEMDQNSSAMVVDTEQPAAPTNTNTTTSTTTTTLTENHSAETPSIPEIGENAVATVERALDVEQDNETSHAIDNGSAEVDGDGDIDMSDHHEYSEDESEYEPEADSPPPSKGPKQPRSPSSSNRPPKTPQGTRPPKTPTSRVRSGRVEKSSSPASQGNLRCPVKGCGQTFTGRNPRQSLWHHLKYYATRGLPDRQDFEKLHGEAHSEMKREAGKFIS